MIVGLRCRDIAPVPRDLISVNLFEILIPDQDIVYKIIPVFLCRMFDQVDELSSANYIDSSGDRVRICHHRLFFKLLNPHGVVHLDRPKSRSILSRYKFLAHNSNIRLFLNVVFQDVIVIHLVHRITGCDNDVRLMALLQEIEILINRIRGSPVPVTIFQCNGWGEYKKSPLLSSEIPPLG